MIRKVQTEQLTDEEYGLFENQIVEVKGRINELKQHREDLIEEMSLATEDNYFSDASLDTSTYPTDGTSTQGQKRSFENNFILPIKTAKINSSPQPPDFTAKNRFETLSVTQEGNVEMETENSNDIYEETPILIPYNENHEEIIKGIIENTKEYPLSKISKNYVRIIPKSAEQDLKIKSYLATEKIDHILTTPKSMAPIKYVLRGLPLNINLQKISAELSENGLIVTKITRMEHPSKKTPMPLFLHQFPPEANTKEIESIKVLSYLVVKMEKYRGPAQIIQCYRCQRFGYHSENCRRESRCVRCTGAHDSRSCPEKEHKIKPTCVNCKKQHVASFRRCEAAPKKIPRKNSKEQNRHQPPPSKEDFPALQQDKKEPSNFKKHKSPWNLQKDSDGGFGQLLEFLK